ncbi:hypothetical protein F4778DRAFT_617503 [Xylariomycetidae sp. FL2044]|nr:hypothetical protein F4778DRAFT_617503 [Xylariomycetidae sp. FL2044]
MQTSISEGRQHELATIGDLPFELLVQIASNETLTAADRKAFRLICRACNSPGAAPLYYRVVLSRLREDLDVLENIAARPHIAQHVHQLIWHELPLEAWDWPTIERSGNIPFFCRGEYLEVEIDFVPHARLMREMASDTSVFWIPRLVQPHGEYQVLDKPDQHIERPDAAEAPLSRFLRLLDCLPRLNTFITRPMPYHKTLTYRGYKLRLDLYLHHDGPGDACGNRGFFAFMLPAMARPHSNIHSLHYADERLLSSLPTCLRIEQAAAFTKLTSLDLCLRNSGSPKAEVERTNSAHLAHVESLSAAETLQNLRLCCQDAWYEDGLARTIFSRCTWPYLRSVGLFEIHPDTCRSRNNDRDVLGSFVDFVERHSKSLRDFELGTCHLIFSDIVSLSRVQGLELKHVKISSRSSDRIISEEALLSIINGRVSHARLGLEPDAKIATHTLAPPVHHVHDWHRWGEVALVTPDSECSACRPDVVPGTAAMNVD